MHIQHGETLAGAIIITGRQVYIHASLVVQHLTLKLELLDVSLWYAGIHFEFWWITEVADDKRGILFADPIINGIRTEGIEHPFPVDNKFILDANRSLEIHSAVKKAGFSQRE